MQLITEQEVRATVSSEPSTAGVAHSVVQDARSASLLRTFLVLTEFTDQFLKAGWPPESIFWSRYYWFRRFVIQRTEACGSDAGLEQQAIKILEQPFPACAPDWSELELVEQTAHATQ